MSIHMWLLIAVLGITSFFAYTDTSRAGKRHCVQCITVLLTCFSGFRSWQMGDVFHYRYAFQGCQLDTWTLDWTSNDTIGLQLFYRLIGKMGLGFEVCLFLIAAFAAVTLGVLIFRYSSSPSMSYLLYLGLGSYIFTFSGLKQTIAMSFITLAMIAILEKRPVKFLVLTVAAGFFHAPALIFLPAYLIARKRINFGYFLICLIIGYLMYNFRGQIVEAFTKLYYENELEFAASENLGGKFIMILFILAVAAVIRPVQNFDYRYRCFFNIMVAAAVIQSASIYDNVFTRLADYYFQFFVIFLPMMLEPGYVQAREYPEHRRQIRYWPEGYYTIARLVVYVGVIWLYIQILKASTPLLSGFRFFWEADPAATGYIPY